MPMPQYISASALALVVSTTAAGAAHAPRVVGGENAALVDHPWSVALLSDRLSDREGDYRSRFQCGGTIVAAQWIVTAASCVDADLTSVLVGLVDLAGSGGQEVDIAARYIHPDYRAGRYDIALLKLSEPLDFNRSGVAPIDLLDAELAPELTAPGMPAEITGWGRWDNGWPLGPGYQSSEQLQVAQVQIYDRSMVNGVRVTDEMLVAGGAPGSGITSCTGDMGNPLVVYDPIAPSMYRLAGVTTWGEAECATPTIPGPTIPGPADPDAYARPGIYTRVSAVADWIESYIHGDAAEIHDHVQLAYLACYGRPADPAGARYWREQLAEHGGEWTQALIYRFLGTQEYASLLDWLAPIGRASEWNDEIDRPDEYIGLINFVYRTLFGRDAEPAALAYYTDAILYGARDESDLALVIANSAQGADREAMINRLRVAEYATQALGELQQTHAADPALIYFGVVDTVDASPESVRNAYRLIDAQIPLWY